MSSFRIRPRFKQLIKAHHGDIEQKIRMALANEKQFVFKYLPGHIYIRIHPDGRHFWSPQLHLTFEQEAEYVVIRGLYGPNPSLWAVFFFGYVILGLLALFIGAWGFSLWSLGKDASMLWGIPVLGGLALLLYLASQAGQKLGAQQMFDIHHFYEQTVNGRVLVS
ncbi:hypothetical protein C900_02584 [Fulvivirga imtechensis AK7]|uniref:Uncharacterized protein n=1 Tax=Fulvivirga imtechensis AK7 TaxID=1237149 RepID=L8JRB9_9BACT|nr:hypothetical protein [Fulvivirga imtechensis]ELR71521.1 hypothetical protein C900_02584 [Fulvivirga imtechensis AK7]